MAGRNYERGRAFEYRVKKRLEREGFFVVRSAGSRFPDLVAVKDGTPYAVECKKDLGRLSRGELEKLLSLEKYGIVSLVAYRQDGRVAFARARDVWKARVERVGAGGGEKAASLPSARGGR